MFSFLKVLFDIFEWIISLESPFNCSCIFSVLKLQILYSTVGKDISPIRSKSTALQRALEDLKKAVAQCRLFKTLPVLTI